MTALEARAQIEALTQARADPVLTDEQLLTLLQRARRADTSGRVPSDADWESTYDIAFAVAEGWEMKAQNVVLKYDFQSKGRGFQRSQIYQHCLEMSDRWKRKLTTSSLIPGATASADAALLDWDQDG